MHTVLVVDDEPASLRAVQRALAAECAVCLADDGAAALEVLARRPLALVIADQRMPAMSGTELLARVAQQWPQVMRILLTGYTEVQTLTDAINAGHVYAYLSKPWEPHQLRLMARRALQVYDAEHERRRLAGELEHACRRLQREAEQKSRLLTVAAHELGTPVHVLAHALSFIAAAELPAATRSWVDQAQRSAEWLGRGLAQMRTAARWRGGALTLRRRTVDVAALLSQVQTSFAPVLKLRCLTLHARIAADLPPVLADPVWLQRALSNLMSNGIRFTPDGGSLTLSAVRAETGVELSVSDTGIGIAPELLEEIFEPFSAAAGDLSLHASGRFEFNSRGLGLGLAITKAIVDHHGGTVVAESRPGAGSRFTLRLPGVAVSDDAGRSLRLPPV